MLAALIFAALVVPHVEAMSVQPATCSVRLEKFERQIAHSKSSSLEGPTAAQTVGAQLHRQPTSAAVKSAENKAEVDFQIALARARAANARGDENCLRPSAEQGKRALRCPIAGRLFAGEGGPWQVW